MTPPYGWLVTRDKKFYNYTQKIFTFTILLVYTLLEPRFRNSFFSTLIVPFIVSNERGVVLEFFPGLPLLHFFYEFLKFVNNPHY